MTEQHEMFPATPLERWKKMAKATVRFVFVTIGCFTVILVCVMALAGRIQIRCGLAPDGTKTFDRYCSILLKDIIVK